MRDAALDLFLGSRCAGCDRPGRMLCPACRRTFPTAATEAWPTPTPPGLVTPWAVTAYEGAVRHLVIGHKDEGQLGHRRMLGRLLGVAVAAAVRHLVEDVPVLLVPVPSRPGAVRRRGYAPTLALATAAARDLRPDRDVRVADLLASRGGLVDQAGLDAGERAQNVAGSMACSSTRLRRTARRSPRAHVVVVDDVITTGVTLREAQRALSAVGLSPVAAAVVAATPRRHPAR